MNVQQMLPDTFEPKKLSFFNRWGAKVFNVAQVRRSPLQIYKFSYFYDDGEQGDSRVVVLVGEREQFPLVTRSTLWRVSEIGIERQNEWIVFSRKQKDLSTEGLADFVIDSMNYLSHLRDEDKRLNPA